MKKILIGIFIGICFIVACSSTSSNKSKSNNSALISTIIKNSNFKVTEIATIDDKITFYKVYVTSKSHNGNYIHELLVTKYIGYNVTVTELSSYHESYANDIIK